MHGRPCLSHRSGVADAQPETMGSGGLFANNENEYAQFLSGLLRDASLREALGTKGKEHAERYYSLQACVSDLSALYRQLLEDPERLRSVSYRLRRFKIRVIGGMRCVIHPVGR